MTMSDDECLRKAMEETTRVFKKYKAPSFITFSTTSDNSVLLEDDLVQPANTVPKKKSSTLEQGS